MPTKKKIETKKAVKGRKLEIKDLDCAKDPKGGGLNFEEVKSAVKPPAGADDALKFSWGMHKGG